MTKQEFQQLCEKQIIYLDGATGSNLMKAGMPMGVCPEKWILEHEQALVDLQTAYIEAGTNILYEEAKEERTPKESEITENMEPEKEVAPAQKPAETLSKPEFPEETEIVKEDLITRKEYIDTLTVHGMAEYFGRSMRELDGWEKLKTNSFWEHWLKAEVDENGREILEEDKTEQIEGQLSVEDFKEIMPGEDDD